MPRKIEIDNLYKFLTNVKTSVLNILFKKIDLIRILIPEFLDYRV